MCKISIFSKYEIMNISIIKFLEFPFFTHANSLFTFVTPEVTLAIVIASYFLSYKCK